MSKINLNEMDSLVSKIIEADMSRKKLWLLNKKSSGYSALLLTMFVAGYFCKKHFTSKSTSSGRLLLTSSFNQSIARSAGFDMKPLRELTNPEIYFLEKHSTEKAYANQLAKYVEDSSYKPFVWN